MRLIGIVGSLNNLCQKNNLVNNLIRRNICGTTTLAAGHSKWANIKHIKAEKDEQKATLFKRVSRQIRLAIQEGGGSADPNLNSQLRNVIEDAVRKNMPMASIQNTIKKCQQTPTQLKRYQFELRVQQKIFALCILFTDNLAAFKIAAAPILKKFSATQAEVSHLFDDFGLIEAKPNEALLQSVSDLEERVTEDAIESGAEEVEFSETDKTVIHFICSPSHILPVRHKLEQKGYIIEHTEHIYIPKNQVQLTEAELKSYNTFLQKMRELQGVDEIYDNVALV